MSFPDMGGSVCGDQAEEDGGRWHLCRKEIEENSPSRQDGMDLRKESYLRRSYCRFLQDLGKRFKLHPATIATAIIMCHRFFLRQSHSKNDRMIIATACMFLACKVKETMCSLKDIVVTSYDIVHQKDSEQVRSRIVKDNGFYEKQKEVVLVAERVVLSTLGYDFDVPNPYMPLVEGVKRLFEVGDQRMVAQVAWSLVNDSLRTSLLLQFEAHHVAAGAIFLAAKLLKLKPNRGNELDVVQLDDIINQMLEMYDQVPQDKVGISLKPAPPRTDEAPHRTDEAPKPSSCKRKAGDSPDKLADRKQRQRLDYLSEDRYSDRDHRRHDRGQRYPSPRRHHYDDHRSEDRWWRGGQREYDRARLRRHEECRY